jgi:hypothetical protein
VGVDGSPESDHVPGSLVEEVEDELEDQVEDSDADHELYLACEGVDQGHGGSGGDGSPGYRL